MTRHSFIVALAAGATLTVGGCGEKTGRTDEVVEPAPTDEVPDTDVVIANPPGPMPEQSALPTWDEVPSRHPDGATNPPIPYLITTPDGDCYKKWVSPMMRIPPDKLDKWVEEDCGATDCGTQIQCPDAKIDPGDGL